MPAQSGATGVSPVHGGVSPVHEGVSPVHGGVSPVHEGVSPVHGQDARGTRHRCLCPMVVRSSMNPKRPVVILVALLALSCLVQVVVIRRATTTARDSVRFVGIAQRIDQAGLLDTIRSEREQPLFPAWVWLLHGAYWRCAGESPTVWADSVQLAAAIPLVLAIVPLYFSILRLIGPRAAIAGSFFFCLLPEVSRLAADGISDSTHLLFFCTAFWAMVEYFGKHREPQADARSGSPWWLILAGVATALAALARVEVLVLAAALGAMLAGLQLQAARRLRWKTCLSAGGGYLLGLAVIFGPFLAAVDALSPRAAVARVLGRADVKESTNETPTAFNSGADWRLDGGEPASFDEKERNVSIRQRGYAAAIVRFVRKLARAFGYWIGAVALFGAWRLSRRGADRLDRFVQVFFLMFSLIAVWFSAVEGYLDPRHLLPLVAVGMGSAGYGACELGRHLHGFLLKTSNATTTTHPVAAATTVVLVAGFACLPRTLAPLHDSRLGHRQAARWLAACDDPSGAVIDTHGWTGLYSGRKTYAFADAAARLGDPRLAYLVLQSEELTHASPRSRTLQWLIDTAGQRLAEFPDPAAREPDQQPVLVYRGNADRFRHRVAISLGEMQLRLAERDGCFASVSRTSAIPAGEDRDARRSGVRR